MKISYNVKDYNRKEKKEKKRKEKKSYIHKQFIINRNDILTIIFIFYQNHLNKYGILFSFYQPFNENIILINE